MFLTMLFCLGVQDLGDNQRFLFGARVVWISVAATQPDAPLDVCSNSAYSTNENGRQKPDQ
jgi:hypothetical protein